MLIFLIRIYRTDLFSSMLLLSFGFFRLFGLGVCLCRGFGFGRGPFGVAVERVVGVGNGVNFMGIGEGVVQLCCGFLRDLFGYFGYVNFVTLFFEYDLSLKFMNLYRIFSFFFYLNQTFDYFVNDFDIIFAYHQCIHCSL